MSEQEQNIEIAVIKQEQKTMSQKIDDLKETVLDGFKDIKGEFSCLKKESDNKYASKLTETIVYALCGLILLGVATGVVALVIK